MSSTQGPRPLGRPWNYCIFLWAGTIKRRHHSIWIPLLSFKKGSREYCIYAYWILLIVLEKCEILSTFFSFLVKLIQHKNCWHLCLPPSSKTLHWHELQMYVLNSSQMSSSVERKTSEISMKWREVKLLLCWFMLPPFIYLLYFFFWRLTCLNSLWHDAVKKLVITYTWVTSCKNVNYTKMLVAFKGTVSQIYVSFFFLAFG